VPVPRIIEFLESLEREGGGHLVEHAGYQMRIPFFPPNTTARATITPLFDTYAMIGHRVIIDAEVVPNAFSGTVEHRGRHQYAGTMTSGVINEGLDFLLIITNQSPLNVTLTNRTALNQYWGEIALGVLVYSHEDYLKVRQHLSDLANSGYTALANEAVKLLREMRYGEGKVQ